MRLWAVLNRKSLDVLKYKEWYFEGDDRHLKYIDREFLQTDVKAPYGVIDEVSPITAYARVDTHNVGLSLWALTQNFLWLVREPVCLERDVILWELEVPESFILSMKPKDKSYEEYPGMPKGTPSWKKHEYVNIKNAEFVVKDNFKNHLRHKFKNQSVEVCIPYLYLPHVVCYREFEEISNGCHKVKTTVLRPDAFPTWTEEVCMGTDGYMRESEPPHKSLSFPDESKLMTEIGMKGAPRYYSIEEALHACDGQTWRRLNAAIVNRNISRDRFSYVTVNDLFPQGLRE